MAFSKVPRIELDKDGTATFFVSIGGFRVGTPVEISGYAIQTNGAVAKFRHVEPMPDGDPEKGVIIVVSDVQVIGPAFTAEDPIMVVARAADVWIDKLNLATGGKVVSEDVEAALAASTQVGIKIAWNSDDTTYHSALGVATSSAWPAESPSESPLLRHGTWWDRRKTDPLDEVMEGRFTRLFPYLPGATFGQAALKKLAGKMTAPAEPESTPESGPEPEENPGIPAAYTYLGQFIDHDVTFDPISHLREALAPAQLRALVNFRTPRFDLDSLYGRGPDDQPYLYEEDGIRMLLGERMAGERFDPGAVQLPRGPSGRALIGDPRNDENRIVAQLHAIFLRFHNEVVRQLGGKNHVSFDDVRDQVRWHYQWVLVNDFLPTILDKQTYESVFPSAFRYVTTIPRLRENDLELMPVEFSVAAYRFGHSMIRPRYLLNPAIKGPIPIFSGDTADLGGFRPIPPGWAIDWQFFIDLGHDAGRKPQLSYKIDTSLAHPLGNLPPRIARDPPSLALRNLERGVTFQLPSGQQVARALGMEPLDDKELMIGKATAEGPQKRITKVADGFAGNAPLWAYILSEAQVMSWKNAGSAANDDTPIQLGPVGGRLVAEVFASLLRGDQTSYLHAKPAFVPRKEFTRGGEFGLAELINVALGRTS